MGSGRGEKMKPLKKARLGLFLPPFFTGLLLIFTFLLLFAGSSPGLLPSAHVFALGANKVYLMTTCPGKGPDNTLLKCERNAGLNPIKWAALWYWAAVVALATALPFQSCMFHRPDPKWAVWAFRALLPATFTLVMGSFIAVFIGKAAATDSIQFMGQPSSDGGEANQMFSILTIALASITCANCVTMWYLEWRLGKEPVATGASPYPLGGMGSDTPNSTRRKQDTKPYELKSNFNKMDDLGVDKASFASAIQGVSVPRGPRGYADHGAPPIPSSIPPYSYSAGAPPGQPRGGPYLSDRSGPYGGHGGRGGYQ